MTYHYVCHILLVIQTNPHTMRTIKVCKYQKSGIIDGLHGGCLVWWECCHVAIHVRSKGLTSKFAPFYRLPLTNNNKSSLTLHDRKKKLPLGGSYAGVSVPSAAPWLIEWWISGMRKWGWTPGLKREQRKKPNTDSNFTKHSFRYISKVEKHLTGINVFTLNSSNSYWP